MKPLLLKNGFHLIEILIVLTIVSILATLAVPVYNNYLVQEKRLEAINVLNKLAVAMEQYHLLHHSYRGATLAEMQFPAIIAQASYKLAIDSADDLEYLLSATPLDKQAEKDKKCGILKLSSNGEQSVSKSGSINECW